MSSVSTYLNFQGQAEEAFTFYKSVFGTEYETPFMRIGDMPPSPDAPPMSEADKKMVMHVALPILAGHVLMATDMVESFGQKVVIGNNTTISLNVDTRAEADRLYAALSTDGSDCAPLADMFFGYWGCCLDRFGIRWMFNCNEPKPEA